MEDEIFFYLKKKYINKIRPKKKKNYEKTIKISLSLFRKGNYREKQ